MAVDRVRPVRDPRRWAAFHTTGVYTLLLSIQASQEDLLGALDNDQIELARHGARRIALLVARVRCLLADGVPEDDDPLADVFAGLSPDSVAVVLDAAAGVIRAPDAETAKAAVPALDALVDDLVRDLGFPATPKSIRTPAGLFPALRLTRELLPLNRDADLPLVVPESWVNQAGERPQT